MCEYGDANFSTLSNQRNRSACEADMRVLVCKTKIFFPTTKMESNACHTRHDNFSMTEKYRSAWMHSRICWYESNVQQHEQQQRLTKIIQQVSMHLAKEKRIDWVLFGIYWVKVLSEIDGAQACDACGKYQKSRPDRMVSLNSCGTALRPRPPTYTHTHTHRHPWQAQS